jgi:hypothetical protein
MKTLLASLATIILFSVTSIYARAGTESHGGDSVLSPVTHKPALLDLVEQDDMVPVNLSPALYDKDLNLHFWSYYFTAEYLNNEPIYRIGFGSPAFTYFMMSAAGVNWESCKNQSGCHIKANPDFMEFLRKTHYRAHALKWYFTTKDLKDIGDEGVLKIQDPSTKKQVAAQQNGIVVINEVEFKKLDGRNKAALLLHEMAIYAVVNLNPKLLQEKGTEPVRTFIRRVIRQIDGINGKTEPVDGAWVMEAFQALGIQQ